MEIYFSVLGMIAVINRSEQDKNDNGGERIIHHHVANIVSDLCADEVRTGGLSVFSSRSGLTSDPGSTRLHPESRD